MDALREPFGIDLPRTEEKAADQDHQVSGKVAEFTQGEAFGKDEDHAGERKNHTDDFEAAEAVSREEEVSKEGCEEGIGGDENRGAAGQGEVGACIEKVDLRDKEADQLKEASPLAGF